jgi:hypothetical protein
MIAENTNMENISPLSFDADVASQTPDQIVDALQTIVSDVDAFVSNWFRRLDQCVESCQPGTTPDAILQKRIQDFQNDKTRWEAQRKSDERQIQEQAQQLTEAWLRLEDEQRKFLQMKDPQRPVGNGLGPLAKPLFDLADGSHANDVEPTKNEPSTASSTKPAESFLRTRARDSAIRQFQQLRREIESTRPNIDRSCEASQRGRRVSRDRP